jgi:hypothetical protein
VGGRDALWAQGKLSQELVETVADQARDCYVPAGSGESGSRFVVRRRGVIKGGSGERSGDVLLF